MSVVYGWDINVENSLRAWYGGLLLWDDAMGVPDLILDVPI
jgi:hypothetical protein